MDPSETSSPPSGSSNGASTTPPHPTLAHGMSHSHRPSVPSALRQTHMPPSSPEARFHRQQQEGYNSESEDEISESGDDRIHPHAQDFVPVDYGVSDVNARGDIEDPPESPSARTRLLEDEHKYHILQDCGHYNCNHGTLSPRPRFMKGYGSIASNYDGMTNHDREGSMSGEPVAAEGGRYRGDFVEGDLGDAVTNGLLNKWRTRNTTAGLLKKYGVRNEQWLYLLYYIPFTNWIRQYRWSYLKGDFIAAVTMASFYIPMALSLASNLAHVPPINGLYSFAINPFIYALLGTCPQMVVGPEAAGSLLTGSVVKEAIKAGTHPDNDGTKHASGSRHGDWTRRRIHLRRRPMQTRLPRRRAQSPLLAGFHQCHRHHHPRGPAHPEMGLNSVAKDSQAAQHGSSLDKILFLGRHWDEAHSLTCAVSFSTIAIVLFLREVKRRLQGRMPWIPYVPDRFVVVVLSAIFAWKFDWESQGLEIMGDIRSQGTPFRIHFPFDEANFHHVNDAFSTAFIISLLGFFESSVAAKSLGSSSGKTRKVFNKHGEEVEECDGIRDMHLSPNRELVALGVANLMGGLFMALPGFGGYGRSKVNASTGGKTPMSSIFLALITIFCILFLLPYFYYIPVRLAFIQQYSTSH